MPPRNSIVETIATAASRCVFLACQKHFESVPLGNVVDIVSGGTPSTDNPYYWDGEIVWITPKDLGRPRNIEIGDSDRKITEIGLANSSARLLPIGTVLLSSRAPIGHLGISDVPLATNQGFKNLICSDAISNRYLFHMLRASIEQLQSLGRGNTFLEIPAKIVKDFFVPLPPLVIQHQIADFLDSFYARLSGDWVELPELPDPISEQRRSVAHIEALAARIVEARGLRHGALEEADQILSSLHIELAGQRMLKVGDFLRLDERQENIVPGELYPQVGMKGFGQGLFGKSAIEGSETSYRVFNRLYTGAIVLSQVKGWEGAIGVCPIELNGWYASPEYRTFSCIEGQAIPDYLALLIPCSWFWTKLKTLSRGIGGRRERVRPELFVELEIPMPDIEQQRMAIEILAEFDVLRRLQSETAAELDALLPSLLDQAFKGEL